MLCKKMNKASRQIFMLSWLMICGCESSNWHYEDEEKIYPEFFRRQNEWVKQREKLKYPPSNFMYGGTFGGGSVPLQKK